MLFYTDNIGMLGSVTKLKGFIDESIGRMHICI